MTEDEKKQFNQMHEDLNGIKKDLNGLSSKVDKMYNALMGSELSKDGGMVQRIVDLETENKTMHIKLAEMEKSLERSAFHVKIMWLMGGVVLATLFTNLMSIIFKR